MKTSWPIPRAQGRKARVGVAVAAVIVALAATQAAQAQRSDSVNVDVGECVDLAAPEDRFTCYERRVEAARGGARPAAPPGAATAPVTAEQSAEIGGNRADAEKPRQRPTRAPARSETEEEREQIIATVTELQPTVPNSYIITLDNGQVWRQTQSKRYPLHPGFEVRIYPSPWGNTYRLTLENRGSFIQVERVR